MKAKPITDILNSNSWKGRRCFILAGGPSLSNFNFDILKDEITIGINKAFIEFSTTLNYSLDKKFYCYVTGAHTHPDLKDLPRQWSEYAGLKVFLLESSNKSTYKDVYTVKRKITSGISFSLDEGIISKSNSGFGAIMLAIALGANPIYLLGYDMKIVDGKTHWHEGYPNQDSVKIFTSKLDKYNRRFEEYAPRIEEAGISVINLSHNSALECFDKDDISNIL